MNSLSFIQVEWGHFFMTFLIIGVLFILLTLASFLVGKISILGGFRNQIDFKNLNLIFEPLAVIILIVTFVMVSPVYHGLIIGIILIASFNFIKNYFLGRIIQVENPLSLGMRINIQDLQGIISKISRSGVYLRTGKGARFFSFMQLYADGFMILSGEEAGGFYQLSLTPLESNEKQDKHLVLLDALAMAPYVDRNYIPEITRSNRENKEDHYNVKVFVKEEYHLFDLLKLIKEWGFESKISKK